MYAGDSGAFVEEGVLYLLTGDKRAHLGPSPNIPKVRSWCPCAVPKGRGARLYEESDCSGPAPDSPRTRPGNAHTRL